MNLFAGRRFVFNWKVTLFAFVCLALFIKLGFWQLQREDEKRRFIAEQQTRAAQAATVAADLPSTGDLNGLPVALSGHFDPDVIFLLDNRVLDGQVGFEVHQLFLDTSGRRLLVNRGFVPMGRTRQDPVDIPAVDGLPVQIQGRVYQSVNGLPLVHNGVIDPGRMPVIVQHIDIAEFGRLLEMALYPHIIRLAETETGALPRHWPGTVMLPEQHRGYAIQWFTLALVVTLAWLLFSFRRRASGETETTHE